MIGRGVIGNTWLIRECVNYLDYGIKPDIVSLRERYLMIKKHALLLYKNYDENVAFSKLKKHSADYMKNLTGNSRIKQAIFQAKDSEEVFNLIKEYFCKLDSC
jgi:tRNA-dihydrouridine synthase